MPQIDWDNSFSVKIDSIDNQHKKLFSILNNLSHAVDRNVEVVVLKHIIEDLRTYAELHFSEEEMYFEKFNFPHRERHIKQHKEYIKKIDDLHANHHRDHKEAANEIVTYLENWIKKHIKIEDKKYTDFFKKNGVN